MAVLRMLVNNVREYLEPGPRDADEKVTQLIAVLDTQDLARTTERLEKGRGQ